MQDVATFPKQTTNGWSNQETYLANLWLNNDEPSYQTLLEAFKQGDEDFDHAYWLESTLREQLDEESSATMWGDLLGTAFDRINWMEVIENNRP